MNNIDIYCEILGPELLAEPINLFTNISFLVAALLLSKQTSSSNRNIKTLIFLIFTIGIGSILFHSFATPWARILDVIPILIFQMLFVWTYIRRVINRSTYIASLTMIIILTTSLAAREYPQLLNGSLPYLPALTILLGLGLYHHQTNQPKPFQLLIVVGLFITALVFRTMDSNICHHIPIGTHFIWHLVSAYMLYLSVDTLIPQRR
ncbi:ceramidase domain-containing protein [Moritella sp. F3]|uniref:ceramidase domain-containing protein n=1 Tax=Moritella sp. F3 TaxID=2718882 RepID=UPI0018E176F5|nr:ceramidase domain-containing protein [Moritella sp. F3]